MNKLITKKICLAFVVAFSFFQLCKAPSSLITKYEKQVNLKCGRSLQTFLHHSDEQEGRIKIPKEVAKIIQEFLRKPALFFNMILPQHPSPEIKKAWSLVDEYKTQFASFMKREYNRYIQYSEYLSWSQARAEFEKRIPGMFLFIKYLVTIDAELMNLIITEFNQTTSSRRWGFANLFGRINGIICRHSGIINKNFDTEISRLYFNESDSDLKKNLEMIKEFVLKKKPVMEIMHDIEVIKSKENLASEVNIYQSFFNPDYNTFINKIESKRDLSLSIARKLDYFINHFLIIWFFVFFQTITFISHEYLYDKYAPTKLASYLTFSMIQLYLANYAGLNAGYLRGDLHIMENKVRDKFSRD